MATLFDDASLVMIPSGYKDDKLYSIKPTSGDGDFTFSRDGSGASPATRVNSAGLIEKGRTNLLLQSNSFDTTWGSTNVTETSGQAGYDGTNDAWKLDITAAAGYLNQGISGSGVKTVSIYAKAGTLDWIRIFFLLSGTDASAYFDLSTGTIGAVSSSNIDTVMTDVSNGWYRISVSFNDTTSQLRIYPAQDNNDLTATSGNVYIQNAQLEKGLVATSVIETTTAAASAGILGDMPRLDYSGGATCPSLLLEPARTNLLPQSEYFNGWSTVQNATITENDTTSPEGLENAAKITDNATSGNHRIFQSVTTTAQSYTASVFLKKGTMTTAFLRFNSGGDVAGANVDLNAGTITATAGSATIEDYGNDWYRCTITGTAVAGTSYFYVYMKQLSAYSGSGDDLYLYGAQFEAGSYPTSYVPTYGSATARAKDHFLMLLETAGITSSGQTEATLFIEFEKPNTGENVDLMRFRGTGILGRGYIYNTGVGLASDWGQGLNFTLGENTKAVWRINSLTDGEVFVNGTKSNNASGTAWSGFWTIRFNEEGGGGVLKIKQIALFNTALTDAECTALTT